MFKKIGQALYWLRTHTYNRYHMLDIRNSRNGYSWGWLDRCEGIVFANFAILVDYVEKEKPFKRIDWNSDPGHIEAAKEIRALYRWWKVERKREHDEYENFIHQAYGGEDCMVIDEKGYVSFTRSGDPEWEDVCRRCREVEDALREKDTENLIRLIKVRGYLWT